MLLNCIPGPGDASGDTTGAPASGPRRRTALPRARSPGGGGSPPSGARSASACRRGPEEPEEGLLISQVWRISCHILGDIVQNSMANPVKLDEIWSKNPNSNQTNFTWGPVGRGNGADNELATSERVRSTWEAVTECACRDTESLSDRVSKAGTLPAPPPALVTLDRNSIR